MKISNISTKQNNQGHDQSVGHVYCPECDELIIWLLDSSNKVRERIYPNTVLIRKAPLEVKLESPDLASSYEEAAMILTISPKASAALSRRCLQTILREKAGVVKGDLFDEIKQVVKNGHIPSDMSLQLDNIRRLGNFAAHPNKDAAGLIIDIEPEDAKYSLEAVFELLDYYYVRPARIAVATAQINAKIASKV